MVIVLLSLLGFAGIERLARFQVNRLVLVLLSVAAVVATGCLLLRIGKRALTPRHDRGGP